MKQVWRWMVLVATMVLAIACVGSESRRATEAAKDSAAAWSACSSCGYAPSGGKVTGKYFLVKEEFDQAYLRVGTDGAVGYHAPSGLAERLREASAVLCAKTTGQVVETCSYNLGAYTIDRMAVKTDLILLAWPSGELIARGTLEGSAPPACKAGVKTVGTHDIYYGSLDVGAWLRPYWSAE